MLNFIVLVLIALIAAGAHTLISGWGGRLFAARWVAYALLLVLPTLLPRLVGG